MLSTWPKDGHRLSVSCMPLHLCSCSLVLSRSRSTPWPVWFSDVLLFPKFWHLTNLWHDYLSLHDLLWPTFHFCCPALSVWPCERSVANRFYFFSVFLLSLPIISASLSNICTLYSRSCGMESCTHIHHFALLCIDLLSQCPIGLHGHIYSIFTEYPLISLR